MNGTLLKIMAFRPKYFLIRSLAYVYFSSRRVNMNNSAFSSAYFAMYV